jgi:hypothetical protein
MQKATYLFVYGSENRLLNINQYPAECHPKYKKNDTLDSFLSRLKAEGWEPIKVNSKEGRYVLMKPLVRTTMRRG